VLIMKSNDNKPSKDDNLDYQKERRNHRKILHALEQHLEKTFREISSNDLKPGKKYRFGLDIHVGKDGTPFFDEFGDYQQKHVISLKDLIGFSDKQSLFDKIEFDDYVTVTTEIFGIEKKDIFVLVHNYKLFIAIDTENLRVHRSINLPHDVNPNSVSYSYVNGVLDIVIEKTSDEDFRHLSFY